MRKLLLLMPFLLFSNLCLASGAYGVWVTAKNSTQEERVYFECLKEVTIEDGSVKCDIFEVYYKDAYQDFEPSGTYSAEMFDEIYEKAVEMQKKDINDNARISLFIASKVTLSSCGSSDGSILSDLAPLFWILCLSSPVGVAVDIVALPFIGGAFGIRHLLKRAKAKKMIKVMKQMLNHDRSGEKLALGGDKFENLMNLLGLSDL